VNAIPTLAERLQRVPTGRLHVRLGMAKSAFAYGQTAYSRGKALDEIEAIKAELARREERGA
jgi:hypothetical protein